MPSVNIADPFLPLLDPANEHYKKRWLVFHGGRGSGKSIHAAKACLLRGRAKREKILCFRQFQNSMKDSVLSVLAEQILEMGLSGFYQVQRDAIYGLNGTEFIFRGLHNNLPSIRSIAGVTLAWGEEAQSISAPAYEVLIPTVRAPGSQFILTYNTDLETDPTFQRFNANPPPQDQAYVRHINFDENPWFPEVLQKEMEWCRSVDTDAFMHIWMGEPRVHSDAQILNGKWMIDRFEPPEGVEFMHGCDFGFAQDPTTAIRCYIHEGSLFIYQEHYQHRLEIDQTAQAFMAAIPGIEKYLLRCDNARPETISYIQRNGLPNAMAVDKWPGSVEDGISVLRSFKKIVIHESCKYMIQEAKLYSYKRDSKTNDILPEALDKNNHCVDALRYALDPVIQQSQAGLGYLAFLGAEARKKEAARPVN